MPQKPWDIRYLIINEHQQEHFQLFMKPRKNCKDENNPKFCDTILRVGTRARFACQFEEFLKTPAKFGFFPVVRN